MQKWALEMVSIHAPAWGATPVTPLITLPVLLFQSTPPHGERLRVQHNGEVEIDVSIHAPAWGATL